MDSNEDNYEERARKQYYKKTLQIKLVIANLTVYALILVLLGTISLSSDFTLAMIYFAFSLFLIVLVIGYAKLIDTFRFLVAFSTFFVGYFLIVPISMFLAAGWSAYTLYPSIETLLGRGIVLLIIWSFVHNLYTTLIHSHSVTLYTTDFVPSDL